MLFKTQFQFLAWRLVATITAITAETATTVAAVAAIAAAVAAASAAAAAAGTAAALFLGTSFIDCECAAAEIGAV